MTLDKAGKDLRLTKREQRIKDCLGAKFCVAEEVQMNERWTEAELSRGESLAAPEVSAMPGRRGDTPNETGLWDLETLRNWLERGRECAITRDKNVLQRLYLLF